MKTSSSARIHQRKNMKVFSRVLVALIAAVAALSAAPAFAQDAPAADGIEAADRRIETPCHREHLPSLCGSAGDPTAADGGAAFGDGDHGLDECPPDLAHGTERSLLRVGCGDG